MLQCQPTSPSGVSEGHSIPHCDGWRDLGPDTFLVFSNCEFTRVIIPRAEIYESLDRTCVTPCRSILNLLIVQLPCKHATQFSVYKMNEVNIHSSTDTPYTNIASKLSNCIHTFTWLVEYIKTNSIQSYYSCRKLQ
jgi:hypothetical protein